MVRGAQGRSACPHAPLDPSQPIRAPPLPPTLRPPSGLMWRRLITPDSTTNAPGPCCSSLRHTARARGVGGVQRGGEGVSVRWVEGRGSLCVCAGVCGGGAALGAGVHHPVHLPPPHPLQQQRLLLAHQGRWRSRSPDPPCILITRGRGGRARGGGQKGGWEGEPAPPPAPRTPGGGGGPSLPSPPPTAPWRGGLAAPPQLSHPPNPGSPLISPPSHSALNIGSGSADMNGSARSTVLGRGGFHTGPAAGGGGACGCGCRGVGSCAWMCWVGQAADAARTPGCDTHTTPTLTHDLQVAHAFVQGVQHLILLTTINQAWWAGRGLCVCGGGGG